MSSFFQPAPEPKSLLGRHRILAPTAGVRVSPLCLGAMNFGDAWYDFMGKCDKKTSFEILDYFYEQGGNFIDTANNYQSEESEQWLGEWMKERGVRNQFVIATKYSTAYRTAHKHTESMSTTVGNSKKSLHISLHDSLRKLQTDYIDLLYVHWWDYATSIPEVMQALDAFVKAGKVLYLGISDTPAWIVSKANEYARNHGLTPFSVYQGQWNAAVRDFEREIIPMCRAEGMALAPWRALGGGNFKSAEQQKDPEGRKMYPLTDKDKAISAALEKIAERKGTAITSIALAYVMHKTPYVFPIVGGRNIKHLKGNIEALGIVLSEEEINEIEEASPFDPGFPHTFLSLGGSHKAAYTAKDVGFIGLATHMDYVDDPKVLSHCQLFISPFSIFIFIFLAILPHCFRA
ncbi:Aldo/keto reductase [Xylona heveae TC161]|uniref:Aldo/keto reductase n=1 Tax=Xylona heveae (strain CBS 132557 / TC161) TaxID=1328760 RepID=A0A164ZPP1_XYLHT|nr:Aldo/keto reductase [Xylona heveae TC161]KZF19348.1 Aldo/keto reductase [Xylona heveae TC161]